MPTGISESATLILLRYIYLILLWPVFTWRHGGHVGVLLTILTNFFYLGHQHGRYVYYLCLLRLCENRELKAELSKVCLFPTTRPPSLSILPGFLANLVHLTRIEHQLRTSLASFLSTGNKFKPLALALLFCITGKFSIINQSINQSIKKKLDSLETVLCFFSSLFVLIWFPGQFAVRVPLSRETKAQRFLIPSYNCNEKHFQCHRHLIWRCTYLLVYFSFLKIIVLVSLEFNQWESIFNRILKEYKNYFLSRL